MSLIDSIGNKIKVWIGKPPKDEPVEIPQPEINSLNLNKPNVTMDNNINPSENLFQKKDDTKNDDTQSGSYHSTLNSEMETDNFVNPQNDNLQKTLLETIKAIEDKDTNYIFLFGKGGTGKSYITASLIYYLKTSGLGDLLVKDTTSDIAKLLEQDLYNEFFTGKIINRTNRLEPPYEIDLVFTPKDRKLPKMNITFLEISGENLSKVKIAKNDPHSGKLPDNIDIFFMCKNIKLIFFLVADHATALEDSLLIDRFLNVVLNKNENFDNANYLLAITKWDTYNGKHKKNVEDFTKEFMPNIHNRFINHTEGKAITHYSIGKILRSVDKGVVTEQIQEKNPKRAEEVANWLYRTITKRSLIPEPTAWEKLKNLFGI